MDQGSRHEIGVMNPLPGTSDLANQSAQLLEDDDPLVEKTHPAPQHRDIVQSGFHLDNPNVKRMCGCGESFSV